MPRRRTLTKPATADLLALDTATEFCSVALQVRGRLADRIELAGNRHSEMLLPMVDALLKAEAVDLPSLQAIAFGAGPGSFTGLRIACSVAQGLAWASEIPLLPIGNLEALAFAAFEAAGDTPGPILVAIDARMEEAYWAVYQRQGGRLAEVQPPALARRSELVALVRRHHATLAAGDGWNPQHLADAAGARFMAVRTTARALLALAVQRHAEGAGVSAALAAPLYVRDRVALTVAERRAAAQVG